MDYKKTTSEARRTANLLKRLRAPALQAEAWAEEVFAAWGVDNYYLTWIPKLETGTLKLCASVGLSANVDYYKLTAEIPDSEKLCEFMTAPGELTIEKTYETARVKAIVELKAKVPTAVQARLRVKGIIKEEYNPGTTYETVVCPNEETSDETSNETSTDEAIPF